VALARLPQPANQPQRWLGPLGCVDAVAATALWQSLPPVNWTRWWWLLVPALGLVEWVAHGYYSTTSPTASDWDELAPKIAELRDQEQPIIVAPHWAEPHARRAFGDELMPLEQVARPDNERFAAAIEISTLGQSSEIADWKVTEEFEQGKFTVRLLENPAPRLTKLDFVDLLDDEHATAFSIRRGKDQKEKPCRWNPAARVKNGALHGHPTFPRQRFQCRDGDWHFVGVTVIEDQDYRPRRCIWLHPGKKERTVVRFPDVELADSIVSYSGVPYFLGREKKGAPITFEIVVDGDEQGEMVHEDGEGWKRFEIDTRAFAGAKHTVEFRSHASSSHQREFCFQADVR
jgi:hypothetical protein